MPLSQERAPIYEALEKFQKMRVVPFDVPGHKRGRGNPELTALLGETCMRMDVNSMKPLDNLCHPISVIREAEELAAEAFGAAHAFLMVGGTTSAVQSMILSVAKRGEKIILPRNVHRSVMGAMVLCGAVMTLCLLLFLSRRTGRYLAVSLTAFILFAATAYIPPITAGRLSVRSQMRRADAAARSLGVADAEGRLRLGTPTDTDTAQRAQHRILYQSLEYIGRHDPQLLQQRYGVEECDDYLRTLSDRTALYASAYSEPDEEVYLAETFGYALDLDSCHDRIDIDITPYDKLSLGEQTSIVTDSLGRRMIEYDGITIPADEMLNTQLAKIGYTRSEMPSQEEMDLHAAEMLVYRTDSLIVVLSIDIDDQGNAVIENAIINFMIRK